MLLASKQHSGAQTKSRSKLLEKIKCTVTANKGVPPERKELQPQLPQCLLLATNIQELMVHPAKNVFKGFCPMFPREERYFWIKLVMRNDKYKEIEYLVALIRSTVFIDGDEGGIDILE